MTQGEKVMLRGFLGWLLPKKMAKKGPMQTVVTEVHPGCWEYQTNNYSWEFHEAKIGCNLFLKTKKTIQPLLCAKDLDHAIMYSQGYDAGRSKGIANQKRQNS